MSRPVIEDGLAVRCGFCNTDLRWEGKGRDSRKVCDCNSEPPAAALPAEKPGRRKCSHKNAKAKGDGEERAICKAFEDIGYQANRTAGSGAHGSRTNEQAFATDVRVKLGDKVWRIESKRHASIGGVKTLNKLRDNSEILWLREDFAEPMVFCPASIFLEFAALAAEAKR